MCVLKAEGYENHRNAGTMIRSDGTKGNILEVVEDISGLVDSGCSSVNEGSIIGPLSVTNVVPVELKVGATALEGRCRIVIFNDSSYLVYIGFSPTMTPNEGVLLNSGNNVEIKLDPTKNMKIYALAYEGTAEIKIMEIK